APLPAAAAGGALDVPAAGDRPQRHRGLLRRRLHQPRDLQPDLPGDRRGDAVGLPQRSWADRRASLRPDGEQPAPGGGNDDAPIEQFWRSHRRGAAPSLTTFPSPLPEGEREMITKLNVASIYVLDQDEALDFYVNKLGLEKGNDVRQGAYRWLTVRVP